MAKRITRTDAVSSGDLFVLHKTSAGDYRGTSSDVVLQYMQDNLTFPDSAGTDGQGFTTQSASPSSAGFDIAIDPSDGSSVHLILTPTAGFASGQITLPPVANCVDKQEILVNCTQQVTAFTIAGNGANVATGVPVSVGADDFFRLKFHASTSTWYRVG